LFFSFSPLLTPRITPSDDFSPPIFLCNIPCRSMWGLLYMISFLYFGSHCLSVLPIIVIH
jgi:hypothetical protein